MPRCAGKKPDGTPCERIVGASQTHCYSHDESRREERRAAASKAGSSRTGAGEIRQIKGQLRELAEAVVEGRIETGRASVAGQLLGVLCRYIETERRIKETEALEERLERLEEAQARMGGSRWG